MTRKDYVAIAEIVKVAKARYVSSSVPQTIHFFETELADLFARDNGRFNQDRFAKACEFEVTQGRINGVLPDESHNFGNGEDIR